MCAKRQYDPATLFSSWNWIEATALLVHQERLAGRMQCPDFESQTDTWTIGVLVRDRSDHESTTWPVLAGGDLEGRLWS